MSIQGGNEKKVFSRQNCKVSTRCRTHNIGLVNMGLVIAQLSQRVDYLASKNWSKYFMCTLKYIFMNIRIFHPLGMQ